MVVASHVFIVRSDIRQLAVDARLVLTDPAGNNPQDWFRWHPAAASAHARLRGHAEGSVVQVAEAPPVWAGTISRGRSDEPEFFAGLCRSFIAQAADRLIGGRRLLAVPALGTGHSSACRVNTEVIQAVLRAAQQAGREHKVDIVYACFGRDEAGRRIFSAAQAIRKRLAAQEPGWWEDLTPEHAEGAARLARLARAGRLVLFTGAGVSVPAGLPTWPELIKLLSDLVGLDDGLRELLTYDTLDQAELLRARLEEQGRTVGEAVATIVKEAKNHALGHALLADLPVEEVVTLNYDRLFEQAVAAMGDELAVLPQRPSESTRRWLLKLHGDVDTPKSIVLTRGDYLQYAQQRAALEGIVQALLVTRHLLFVGFGFTDPHFHSIIHQVRAALLDAVRTPEDPLGTALVFGDDPIQHELWRDDLDIVQLLGDPAGQPRMLEIFLDYLSAEAAAADKHFLDPAYAAVLTAEEASAAELLRPLVVRVREGMHVPESLETVLRSLGGWADAEASIPRGTRVQGKRAFARTLRRWLIDTREPTLGDVGAFGGKPWLRVEVGGRGFHLNADTTRAGVARFLEAGPEGGWQVVANRRGRVNKVVLDDGEAISGFFFYADDDRWSVGSGV